MSAQPDSTLEFEVTPSSSSSTQPLRDDEEAGRRSARLALYAGIALLALGWIVLYLGYNGAATHPPEAAQLPYIVSGGFGGASLILLGGIMLVAHILLNVQSNLRGDIQGLQSALEELVDTLVRTQGAVESQSTNGVVVVMRGGSSFHRAGCRLVANKRGLRQLPGQVAIDKGLMPCRVCKPSASGAGVR